MQKKNFLPPRKVKTLVKIFRIAEIGEKWLSIGVPPHFSPKFFFSKMTQNGLKWILNTTLVNVTFVTSCLDHHWGTFAKKNFLPPRKVKTLVKFFRIAKIV